MRNLIKRAVTGAVFVVAIVAAIWIHPLLFAGVFSVIVGGLIHEFYLLSKYDGLRWQRFLGIICGMYLFFSSCMFAGDYVGKEVFFPYILMVLVLLISGLYVRQTNPITQWGILFFTQFYFAGLLSFLAFIPYIQSSVYHPFWVLMIFVFIWLNDTGAYLVGTMIGKHRLFKRISPLKSWEGFFGGLAVVIIASLLLSQHYTDISWYYWLSFAVITAITATFGDLIESLLKRICGVKDSGKLFPGHGGMFDRFDSVLLASPVAYLFFELIIRS